MAGGNVEFRKMTKEEFASFLDAVLDDFPRSMARTFKRRLRQERINARKEVRGLLERGLNTKGHLLFSVVDVKAGKVVGNLWVHADARTRQAFLYYLVVFKRFRRMGYGRATLKLLDRTMKGMKIKAVGLHVFAENPIALRLYRKHGYKVGSLNMIKELG
jgi:ribosomal protein S18 acetylase RimI-like enzyme